MDENRIERHIDLKASPSRVWKALTDYKEFGQWFGCEFEGPFVVGQTVRGKLNHFVAEPWGINVKRWNLSDSSHLLGILIQLTLQLITLKKHQP
jgi:hypothetical protein